MLRNYPGWKGVFTRNQAPGAWLNGTRVTKVWTEPGDAHPLGAEATILGSVYVPTNGYGYFVEWDAKPRYAVLVVAKKIAPVAQATPERRQRWARERG